MKNLVRRLPLVLAFVAVLGFVAFLAIQPSTFFSSPAAPKPSVKPSPSPSPSPSATPSGPGVCTKPVWTSSARQGMYTFGKYIVHNNMWNVSGYKVSQTITACNYNSWYAVSTANNNKGDGAVKTYPNVHVDYHNWSTGAEPLLSSFSGITSTFAHQAPNIGIYDVAYDIWLNGVPGNREVMIWTQNHDQVPPGSPVATVTLNGVTWNVHTANNDTYLAFVPADGQAITSGTYDLLAFLQWLDGHGYFPPSSTLGAIDYGVEIVSTGGSPARFDFTDFSLTSQ